MTATTDDRTRAVAERFARALDEEDYAVAESLLSRSCRYSIRDDVFSGPPAIIASYRAAGDDAARRFDRIAYASSVALEREPRAAVITFEDRIRHRSQDVVYRCQQVVRLDDADRITAIEHRELPGQREALNAFLAKVGLARRDEAD